MGRKAEKRAWGLDVGLEHQQRKGAVKHPQGKWTLYAGDLVLV